MGQLYMVLFFTFGFAAVHDVFLIPSDYDGAEFAGCNTAEPAWVLSYRINYLSMKMLMPLLKVII